MSAPDSKYQTKDELLRTLEDIMDHIKENDTFEGTITYSAMDSAAADDPPGGFRVFASYRVGNSMGQGFVRMVYED